MLLINPSVGIYISSKKEIGMECFKGNRGVVWFFHITCPFGRERLLKSGEILITKTGITK
jgi:hypothetical protein